MSGLTVGRGWAYQRVEEVLADSARFTPLGTPRARPAPWRRRSTLQHTADQPLATLQSCQRYSSDEHSGLYTRICMKEPRHYFDGEKHKTPARNRKMLDSVSLFMNRNKRAYSDYLS